MKNIKSCEKIKLKQGALYIATLNKKLGCGYLELKPFSSLEIHQRACIENLIQIKGKSTMVLFKNNKAKTYLLKQKDKLVIEPANTWHIHVNPYNKTSLSYWYFKGDIRRVVENIKKNRGR